MPTPREDETRAEFIARCIPVVLEDGTAEDQDQAAAVCYSMWENREKGAEDNSMSKTEQPKEHKTLPFIWTKIDAEQGIVEHTVAVMGNVDLGNDRIHPGAFTKTITERAGKIRVLDAHNSGSVLNVIGKPLALWEVGRDELPAKVRTEYPEATGALMARTQFLMDTPEGKGAFARIRDDAISEYSIGYDPITAEYTDEERNGKTVSVRNLKEIRLWEYSAVPFGMNPATSTLSAKEELPRYAGEEEEEASEPGENKVGRTFSAANVARIQGAIDAAQAALGDLESMLASALPQQEEEIEEQAKAAPAPDVQAATGQETDETEAGPDDSSPTKEDQLAEIDQLLGVIEKELSEEQ